MKAGRAAKAGGQKLQSQERLMFTHGAEASGLLTQNRGGDNKGSQQRAALDASGLPGPNATASQPPGRQQEKRKSAGKRLQIAPLSTVSASGTEQPVCFPLAAPLCPLSRAKPLHVAWEVLRVEKAA